MILDPTRSKPLPAWILVLVMGCGGGEPASAGGTSTSTAGTTEPGTTGSTTGGDASTSSGGDSTSGSGALTSSSGGSSGETGTGTGGFVCPDDPLPLEEPSTLTITLEVENDTDETAYLIGSNVVYGCAVLGAVRDGTPVPLESASACGCECAYPAADFSTVALEPGATRTFTWDGRAMERRIVREACRDGCVEDFEGVPVPLAPGPLTLRLGLYTEAASFIEPGSHGLLSLCPAPDEIAIEFELGTTDQTLSVALSDV